MTQASQATPLIRRHPSPAESWALFYAARERALAAPGSEFKAAYQYLCSVEWLVDKEARVIARKAVELLHAK